MIAVIWKPEKNEELKKDPTRPSFDDVLEAIAEGGYRDVLRNKNHPDQVVLVVMIQGYAHAVPCRILGTLMFLRTVFPSRILQKTYGGRK